MDSDELDGLETAPLTYSDDEIVAASGVPLPSLRVLQSARAIRSEKTPKEYGGFRRRWSEQEVLKAAIGAAMSEHFDWNIRLVAEAIAKTKPGTWDAMIEITIALIDKNKIGQTTLVKTSSDDWFLELIDRKFLFIKVPEIITAILPDVSFGQTDLLIGYVSSKDHFQLVPWSIGSEIGRASIEKVVGVDGMNKIILAYKIAMAAHGNYLSKATINIGMQVRAAWRRLHGLEARFVQEAVQPKQEGNDP